MEEGTTRDGILNFYVHQESIPPAYVACRAGPTAFPTLFLVPVDCSNIPSAGILEHSVVAALIFVSVR